MAVFSGAKVPNSGLVLCLDPANIKSYPGTGTSWIDISGSGASATLTNGPTFSNVNGGVFVFDGVNDYAVMTSPGSYSSYTFIFFCKWISAVTYDRIFGLSNFGTYTILSPTNVGFHYNPLGGSPPSVTLSSGVNIGYGTWCQVAVTVNSSSNLVTIYINGVSRNSWSTMPSANFAGSVFLGAQNTGGLLANCHIGSFYLYNRALTNSEVEQTFNAGRSRYGI